MERAQAESFLVVVDATPECRKALRYAGLRAQRTGARVRLLHVLERPQFQQWGGVQEAIEAEQEDEARAALAETARAMEEQVGLTPELRLRRGNIADEVLAEIEADRSIRALVLGAAAKGRPGPLVAFFSGERAGSLPCIVMIIPGAIADADLDRLT
jgi:nucleotide-binding universal stress UspA family protein